MRPVKSLRPLLSALAVLALLGPAACSGGAPPEGFFAPLSFDEAEKAASDQGKFLMADFFATWCGPCRKMDRTTWADSRVEEWVRENAVAIQVDGDEHPDLMKRFSVQFYPTVIFFRDGKEIQRQDGYQNPDTFVTWLAGLPEP